LLLVWWCERDKIRGLFEIKLAKWVKEGLYKWVSLPVFAEWSRRKEKVKKKKGERRETSSILSIYYSSGSSRALYIRFYCSILMFMEPYRESVVELFCNFLDLFPIHREQTPL
jgi:hypothetical protein